MPHDPSNPFHIEPGTPLVHLSSIFERDGEHLIFMFIRLTSARSRLAFYSARLDNAIQNNDTRAIQRYTYYVSIYQGRVNTLEAVLPSHVPPYQVFGGAGDSLKVSAYYLEQTERWEQSQRDELNVVIDEFFAEPDDE